MLKRPPQSARITAESAACAHACRCSLGISSGRGSRFTRAFLNAAIAKKPDAILIAPTDKTALSAMPVWRDP